jgi:hypothetical protein
MMLVNGCAWTGFRERDAAAHGGPAPTLYPEAFRRGAAGVGVGFAGATAVGQGGAAAPAARMALQSLAYTRQVRVRGERLVEPMPNGAVVFCGESVQAVEAAPVALDSCRLDTLRVAGHVWVTARARPAAPPPQPGLAALAPTMPSWVKSPPATPSARYTVASVPAPADDEASGWEAAERRALIDLAFATSAVASGPRPASDRSLVGVQTLKVDTQLRGFVVVARWRDKQRLYVLARAPGPSVPGR